MAVEMTSTPGISRSKGVEKKSPPPLTVAPRTTIRFRISSGDMSPASTDAALIVRIVRSRAIECDGQGMIDVGWYRTLTQRQTVWLDHGLLSDGQRGNAERKRQFDHISRTKQHRNGTRRTGLICRHVDDANFGVIGEFLQRQQESLGRWKPGERTLVIL